MKNLTRFGRKIHIFAAKGPAYYYTYGRWRLSAWFQRKSQRSFEFDETDLAAGLAAASQTDLPDLAEVAAYFRTRTKPVFFFDDRVQELIGLIPDEQKKATIQAADKVCRHIFDFRGVGPVRFEGGVDWFYQPQGNIDWTWDLNRHAYFETLGRAYWYTNDEKYVQTFQALLLDWLAQNQAGLDQPNWRNVFEVAFRINSWSWAFYYFRSASTLADETVVALLEGLLTHGRYLNAKIELHVPNNHLLLEAKALALLGLLFPEFEEAKKWDRRGLKLLFQQLRAQVGRDGVHRERATHYHRVIAGEALELLILMANNDRPVPPDICAIFNNMIEFELWVTKPDGLIPLLNDSALADTYLRFSATGGGVAFLPRPDLRAAAPPLDEATSWLLGAARITGQGRSSPAPTPLRSRAFPEGGYFVMRTGSTPEAAYLVFDCGPFGYKSLPSHGHADALGFELYAGGQTWLVDPGVYSTSLGQDWRNFFRGSRAHNTVVVDDQDQSRLMDTRRVYRPAQTVLRKWLTTDRFDFVDGSHNGYERLPDPITHRRQIFFVKPEYWIVIDVLSGQGIHDFDLYFHLMPDLSYSPEPGSKAVDIKNEAGQGLFLVPWPADCLQVETMAGATGPIQGWVSFFSGQKQPAPVLRYRQTEAAPVQFCTVLYPYAAGRQPAISVCSLELEVKAESAPKNGVTGLRIELADYVDYLVLDRVSAGRTKRFAGYETEAEIFYARHKKDDTGNEPTTIISQGGQRSRSVSI